MEEKRTKSLLDFKNKAWLYGYNSDSEFIDNILGCFCGRVLYALNETYQKASEDNKYIILTYLYNWLKDCKTGRKDKREFLEFLVENNGRVGDDCGDFTKIKALSANGYFYYEKDLRLELFAVNCNMGDPIHAYNINIEFYFNDEHIDIEKYFNGESIYKEENIEEEFYNEFDFHVTIDKISNVFDESSGECFINQEEIDVFRKNKEELKEIINNAIGIIDAKREGWIEKEFKA